MMGCEPLIRRHRRVNRTVAGRTTASRAAARGLLPAARCLLAVGLLGMPWFPSAARAQSYSQNEARLKEMTPDQKEDLRRKKNRFDELSIDEQRRLRDLHQSIATDPNASDLMDTVTRYSRWLATLDSTERSTLLDIKEPEKRIERIKELMHKQEERRFLFYAGNLPEKDRTTIYDWLREFVAAHADEIY